MTIETSENIWERASKELDAESVFLDDGTCVEIRPIRPDDAPGLQALHCNLSPRSRYQRFLNNCPILSPSAARRFAEVDYHNDMALVAVLGESEECQIIGVARYMTSPEHEPGIAEPAIVVDDRFQRQGLGTALARRLITYAVAHGMHTFIALVSLSNPEIMAFIKQTNCVFEFDFDNDLLRVTIYLLTGSQCPS